MKHDLFSMTERRATEFAENIWFSHLLKETIENMIEYQSQYDAAIASEDDNLIKQTKLQLDTILSSLHIAAHIYDSPEGSASD